MVNCSETDPWGNPNIFQCTYGCCGGDSFVYCCSSNGNSYAPKPWQPDLPGYAIAAVTAGCILVLVVVVGVVYALCRHAKKKDKFLEESINKLRVPPARAAGHVNATTKMYPGPRRDVISLPTYRPRDRPQLTSTPMSSPVVPDQEPQPPPARRFGFKSRGTKLKKDTTSSKGTASDWNFETNPRGNTGASNPVKYKMNTGKARGTMRVKGTEKSAPGTKKKVDSHQKNTSSFTGRKK